MATSLRFSLCLTFVGALVASNLACGSSPREAFVNEYCDLLKPCCAAAGLRADGQQCHLLFGAFGSPNYNATAGQACLAEIRAMSETARCGASNMESATCSMVFPSSGTKAPGATCTSDSECAPSTAGEVTCAFAFNNGTTIQKCQVRVRGQEGSTPCVGTVDGNVTSSTNSPTDVVPMGYTCDLADGLRCQNGGACVRLTAIGGSCTSSFTSECVLQARCDANQMCVARKPVGTACTGAQDECVAEAYCTTTNPTCATKLTTGAACATSDQCVSDNCDTTAGTCQPGFGDLGLILICGSN